MEELQSLAGAYERWLAAWPAAVRSWSSRPYAALAASPASPAIADRDRLFVHPSVEWGPVHPRCSPFIRSDAWLGARIDGDRAFTYSWRRGEAACCIDVANGVDLSTGTECVGPLYAVATSWERNPAGDPPWLVVSETYRDPLASGGAVRFVGALAGAGWDQILTLHRAYGSRLASEKSQSDYTACAPRPTSEPTGPTRVTATPAMEREALIALYHALDGPNWTYDTLRVTSYSVSWLSGLRVADWEGVTVTGTAVTGLSRQLRGLAGELPRALGRLTNLQDLILHSNLLTGGIPREIGDLTDLRYLWLGGQFTGAIPREVGNLTNLRVLAIQGGFTGEIPSEVGNLTRLSELILGGQFTGEIPREVGHLFNLQRLSLRGFAGETPVEIGNLAHLTSLTLTDRTGTGTGQIPGEIGNLTKLTELHIQGDFTGEIPREIGNLTRLTELHIQSDFTGEIPREIGNLTRLTELHIQSDLTGEIPREIGNLTNLKTLVLSGRFTGDIPREIGSLTNLTELSLRGQFTGCLPRALRDVESVSIISLSRESGLLHLPECNPPDR